MEQKEEIRSFGSKILFGMLCGALGVIVALSGGYYLAPGTLKSNKKVEHLAAETLHNDSISVLKDTIIKRQSQKIVAIISDNEKLSYENKELMKGIDFWMAKSYRISAPRKATKKDSLDLESWVKQHNSSLR